MAYSQTKKKFVANHLLEKIKKLKRNGKEEKEEKKGIIRTWSRGSTIIPRMMGYIFAIHNGKEHLPIFITKNMLGHKLGEFVPTRNFSEHPTNKDNKSRR